jgi:hypothetical protein
MVSSEVEQIEDKILYEMRKIGLGLVMQNLYLGSCV